MLFCHSLFVIISTSSVYFEPLWRKEVFFTTVRKFPLKKISESKSNRKVKWFELTFYKSNLKFKFKNWNFIWKFKVFSCSDTKFYFAIHINSSINIFINRHENQLVSNAARSSSAAVLLHNKWTSNSRVVSISRCFTFPILPSGHEGFGWGWTWRDCRESLSDQGTDRELSRWSVDRKVGLYEFR